MRSASGTRACRARSPPHRVRAQDCGQEVECRWVYPWCQPRARHRVHPRRPGRDVRRAGPSIQREVQGSTSYLSRRHPHKNLQHFDCSSVGCRIKVIGTPGDLSCRLPVVTRQSHAFTQRLFVNPCQIGTHEQGIDIGIRILRRDSKPDPCLTLNIGWSGINRIDPDVRPLLAILSYSNGAFIERGVYLIDCFGDSRIHCSRLRSCRRPQLQRMSGRCAHRQHLCRR